MLIYVIVCCPQEQGAIICICILICIYIYVIVFYFVFSTVFIGVGQHLSNLITFLALCVLVYVYKFYIIQYIIQYKCVCIYILSYYTYSGTEYFDGLLYNIT